MILSKNTHILAILLAVNFAPNGVEAHGYLKTPRSRNYYASVEGKWSGGTESDPAVETCPHCLNIGGTEARCGFVGDHNYDLPPNSIGGLMPAVTQGCYKPGADITFESVLTAHHMGHFAFKACAISHGEVPTQECFDANPLTFLSDELYGANVDPLYPERAYIPRTDFEGGLVRDSSGDYVMRHKYRLPAGLSGDLVLVQWHYVTGNSCKDVGYDTYNWPDGFYPGNLPVCSQPLPEDGRGVPEQFWNCAELKISNECDGPEVTTTSTTTTSSTSSSTTNGTGATVTTSSTSTTSSKSQTNPTAGTCKAETGACGPDQPCGDGLCCSQWGYCGTTEAYCGECCQNGNCWNDPTPSTSQPTSLTTAAPTNSPVSTPETTTSSTSTSTTTTTSLSNNGELVVDTSNRCGFSEIDARENCKPVCNNDSDCEAGEFCWTPHENYCGSIPKRTYTNPVESSVNSRCGTSELAARTFCGEPCSWQCSKPGESCFAVHKNYCDSDYIEEGTSETTQATTTSGTTTQTTTGTTTSSDNTGATTTTGTTTSTSTSTSIPTTLFPTSTPISKPPTSSAAAAVEAILEDSKDGIDNNILLYQTPSMQWEPSSVYRYNDLLEALRVMYNDGIANKFFFMGDDSPNGHKYGLVNIAAFLAQSMKETIQYNACDENSWDLVNGVYPVSNACGQLGQSYQDYKCSAEEAHMECPVNPNMKIKATTNAKWYGAPAPLYCGPKSDYPFTGYWDHSAECNKPWANPPEYCEEYSGQKAGAFNNNSPVPNSSGRTDVEGCCFWGRGVIQTTGVCNFGKLNYYLGSRAAEEGRAARYPEINFCEQPDAICASEEHKELKWIAGMFYWVESLQSYNVGGWDYITELKKYVDNGMSGNSFIDAVSGIVNRGCHNPPCATGDVDGKADRSTNFYKVLAEFDI